LQKDKDKWPPNCLSWKRRAHSLMKQSISCLGAQCISMAIEIKWCPSWNPLYLQNLIMVLNSTATFVGQLMTFKDTISCWVSNHHIGNEDLVFSGHVEIGCNETLHVRAYHCSLHIACPFFWVRAYMTFWMALYVVIRSPLNGQWAKCMPDASNSCLHSHAKKLNVEG
jgi:hypothetical protein